MQETQTNQLENFSVYRDGELSRWETFKPRVEHTIRSFGARLWINTKDFGNSFDELCQSNSLSATRR